MSKSEWIRRYALFVFDLDGTLYDERAYLLDAYKAVAAYLAAPGTGVSADACAAYLTDTFLREGRERLFDKCLAHFHLSADVAVLKDILHRHQVALQLDPQAQALLDDLTAAGKKVYILTNGHVGQQQNKLGLLGLERRYPGIGVVYASASDPKPSPLCLQRILEKEAVPCDQAVLIGDTDVDARTAEYAHVDFIYITDIKQCI